MMHVAEIHTASTLPMHVHMHATKLNILCLPTQSSTQIMHASGVVVIAFELPSHRTRMPHDSNSIVSEYRYIAAWSVLQSQIDTYCMLHRHAHAALPNHQTDHWYFSR
eukprot:scpid111947/ scgid32785/ 